MIFYQASFFLAMCLGTIQAQRPEIVTSGALQEPGVVAPVGAETSVSITAFPTKSPLWIWNFNTPSPVDADGFTSGSSGTGSTPVAIAPILPSSSSGVSRQGGGSPSSTPGCTNPTRFDTDVFVTYTGTGAITDAELVALQNGFTDTYNSLQAEADLCDSFFRRIDFVSINQKDGHLGPFPPDNSGPFITYRFRVMGSCCGCSRDSNLFFHADSGRRVGSDGDDDDDDDVNKKGKKSGSKRARRSLQSPVCSSRAPTEEEMKAAFDTFTLSGPFSNVQRIIVIDEVEEVACSSIINEFQTAVFVDFKGDVSTLTQSELDQLTDTFLNTYNNLSEGMCDPSFRRARSIGVEFDSAMNTNNDSGFRLIFRVTGVCRECAEDSFLFAPSCSSSRAALGRVRSSGEPALTFPFGGFRKLQTLDATCYCTYGADNGFPCEAEFEDSYEAAVRILFLQNIAAVVTVEEEARTLTPTQFGTREPSISPRPSQTPSFQPTASPLPSASPTSTLSVSPSASPSNSPSQFRTGLPSSPPSNNPSKFPSISPTSPPSQRPSIDPSASPSVSPSNVPSNTPTLSLIPSGIPSLKPSGVFPSTFPSPLPSQPSEEPSLRPTRSPIFVPTAEPSESPRPSPSPSKTPSVSGAPSRMPSSIPSESFLPSGPSASPSKSDPPSESPAPSPSPTETPSTGAPTITGRPSALESASPSLTPSLNPTRTKSPTSSHPPSVAPTESPGPSPSPSEGVPTGTPTISIAPSGPTFSPGPSDVPSATPSSNSPTESPAPSPGPSSKPSDLVPSGTPSISSAPSRSVPTASPLPSGSVPPSTFSTFLETCYAGLVLADTNDDRFIVESEYIPLLEFLGYDTMGVTMVANLPPRSQVAFALATCESDGVKCLAAAADEAIIPSITNKGAKTSDTPSTDDISKLNSICVIIRNGNRNA